MNNRKESHADGWQNMLSGLGSVKDRQRHTSFTPDAVLMDTELLSLYINNGLATRIVDLLPSDMFREGWTYGFEPNVKEKQATIYAEQYQASIETMGVIKHLQEGLRWSRLYGGALIVLDVVDGNDISQPLNPRSIRGIFPLRVIPSADITFSDIVFEHDVPVLFPLPQSENEREQRFIHSSRCLVIHGLSVPHVQTAQFTDRTRFWGVSVLQNSYEHLRLLGSAIAHIGASLEESSIARYRLKGLRELLATTDGEKQIKRRAEVNALLRSSFHAVYMDTEESLDYIGANLDSIPPVLHNIYMLLASDTGYPITRLFGVSPAGMNATGESDMRNYYDMVRAAQKFVLEPLLLRLVQIISIWKKMPEPYINFNSLIQLTEREQIELETARLQKELIQAQVWNAYLTSDVLSTEQVRSLQFGAVLNTIPSLDTVPETE
jgi:phage-related protein (TIGR01555 family)